MNISLSMLTSIIKIQISKVKARKSHFVQNFYEVEKMQAFRPFILRPLGQICRDLILEEQWRARLP